MEGTPCTPVNCKMSSWSEYSSCRGLCGQDQGLAVRDRTIRQEGWCGGRTCGDTRSSKTCTRPEPCDCKYVEM